MLSTTTFQPFLRFWKWSGQRGNTIMLPLFQPFLRFWNMYFASLNPFSEKLVSTLLEILDIKPGKV